MKDLSGAQSLSLKPKIGKFRVAVLQTSSKPWVKQRAAHETRLLVVLRCRCHCRRR